MLLFAGSKVSYIASLKMLGNPHTESGQLRRHQAAADNLSSLETSHGNQYQADLSNMAMASGGTWSMGLKMLCSKNWRRFSLPYDLKKMLHMFMRQQARAAILAAGAGRGRLRGSTNRKQQASALGQHNLFSGHFQQMAATKLTRHALDIPHAHLP